MSEKQPQVITYIGKIDNLNRGEHFKNVTLKLEDQKLVNIKLDLVDESKLVLGRIYQFIVTTELKNETDTFLQCQSYQATEDISDAIEIDRLYDIFYEVAPKKTSEIKKGIESFIKRIKKPSIKQIVELI